MDKINTDVVPENRSIADWEWYGAHGDQQAIAYMNAYRKALYDHNDPCHSFAKRGVAMTENFLKCYGRTGEGKDMNIKFFSEAGEVKMEEISIDKPLEKGSTYYFHYQGPGQQIRVDKLPLKSVYDYPGAATDSASVTKTRLSAATYPITTQSINGLIDKINELEDRLEKAEKDLLSITRLNLDIPWL
jgi:hypothetical protein